MSEVQALEARVAALETKLQEEIDRLYNVEFPAVDEQINRAITNSYEVGNKTTARVEESVAATHVVVSELQQTINAKLAEAVRNLLAQSSSKMVAEALRGQILVVRNATREELKSGDAIAVRNATRDELHHS